MIVQADDIRSLKNIGLNVESGKLMPFCEETEKHIVIPAIGADLYLEIEENLNDPKFNILLNGGFYERDNKKCYMRGLKVAISYIAYSIAVIQGEATFTNFGLRQKYSENSEKVDEKTLIRIANDNRKKGDECLRQCVEYINSCCGNTGDLNSISKRKFIMIQRRKI